MEISGQHKGGHLKNMVFTAGGTMGSRVLGLVRDQLAAGFLGMTPEANAVILAFQIPNLFRRLLGEGALTSALMPVMSRERELGGKERAFAFLNFVMRRIAPLLCLISVLAIAASWLIGEHWEAFASSTRLARIANPESDYALAAKLTALCMPYMPLICLAALFTAALNMLGRFALTSLTAVWLNIAMIVGLGGFGWVFGHTLTDYAVWLCIGSLAGGVLQLLVPAWGLWREGWRPGLSSPESSGAAWTDLKILFFPAVIGAGVQQINLFITRFLAFTVDDKGLTAYYYANRLVELPVGVFAVTVSTVIFSALAAHAARGDKSRFAGDFAHGLRLIFAMNIAAAIGIIALAEPIIRVLFEHGKFDAAATSLTVPVTIVFAISMPFYGMIGLSSRALSAMRDTKTQMRFAIRDLCLNLILAPILGHFFKAPGLAMANLIAVVYQAWTLLRVVRRADAHICDENLVKPLLQTLGAGLAMGLFAYAGWRLCGHYIPRPKLAALVTLAVMIPSSAALYFLLLKAAKYPEMDEIVAVARRRLPFLRYVGL